MKTISDEEYNNALNNPKYIEIMNQAVGPFQQLLHKDVLSRCILIGLFDFLRKYNPKRSKPNTFLTKCVQWECMSKLSCYHHTDQLDDVPAPENHQQEIDDCLACLDEYNKQLVVDYYINNYTYREIADKHGCSHEHIRKKIKKAISKMQKMVYN
jgi:RNA polymerase sigma factor (sigma-70 family)